MRRAIFVLVVFALVGAGMWVASQAEEPMLGRCYDFTDPFNPRSVNKQTVPSSECDHKTACGGTMICDMFQTPCPDPFNSYPYTQILESDIIMAGSCRYMLYHDCQMCPKVLACLRRRAFRVLLPDGNCDGPCGRYYYEGRVGGCID